MTGPKISHQAESSSSQLDGKSSSPTLVVPPHHILTALFDVILVRSGAPTPWETLSGMKAMAGVIGKVYLFPVKGQWYASSYILILLFHISLHKAEREKVVREEKQATER